MFQEMEQNKVVRKEEASAEKVKSVSNVVDGRGGALVIFAIFDAKRIMNRIIDSIWWWWCLVDGRYIVEATMDGGGGGGGRVEVINSKGYSRLFIG